jgi:cysteine synthase
LKSSRYGLASGAASTWRQAAGNCASVIGGLGFGGSFGGLGWMIESLNQKARSPALQPSPAAGSGWLLQSALPGGHLMRIWK